MDLVAQRGRFFEVLRPNRLLQLVLQLLQLIGFVFDLGR